MNIRTFIAMELDSFLQLALQNIQNELRGAMLHAAPADISWVKPANIHITLKFLGEIPLKKVKVITKIFPKIFRDVPSFQIELGRLGVFPTLEHPKIIWVDINKGTEGIKNLAMTLENALCRLGYPKERREFTGHVTIGRVKSLKNREALTQAIKNFKFQESFPQTANKIIFFKSTLHSQGSIYEPLATVNLQ